MSPYVESDSSDPGIKKLLKGLKHGSVEHVEQSLSTLLDSGTRGKIITSVWELLKEIEAIHWSVFNAGEAAKKGTPPDLLSRGLGTCSCCFGEFHVRKEKMVRHGQRKVQDYMWSATCYGVDQPPLEISTRGLEDFIGRYERGHADVSKEVASPDAIQSVPVKTRDGIKKINRGEPGFEKALDVYLVQRQREIKDMAADLEILRDRLDYWTKKHSQEPKGLGR